MFLTKDDFRIKASSFDLTQGGNLARVALGAFMLPHIVGKFSDLSTLTLKTQTVAFFEKAGMVPGAFWTYLAAASETLAAVFLILGLCTRYAALGEAAILCVAAYAIQVTRGFGGWTWNTGGYEFLMFWAVMCVALAIEEFKRVNATSAATYPLRATKLAL